MTIQATLGWQSEIADGASRDAAALRRLVKALQQVGTSLSATSTAPLGQSLGQVGNAAAIAAVQVQALKNAQEQESNAAKSAAAQNAAMAKLVMLQAKGAQDRARIEAQGAQQRLAAEQAADQKAIQLAQAQANAIEQIELKHAAKMAEIQAQEAARAQRAASRSRGGGGGAPSFSGAEPKEGTGNDVNGAALLGMGGGYQAAFAAIISIEKAAVEKGYELIEQGTELTAQATAFREAMVGAFEGMGKSAAVSEHLYRQAIDLAIKLNRDPAILAAEFKRLSSSGFKDDQVASIAKMLADVSAVKGEGKANQLEKVLEKVNAKGSLDPRVITALTNQGFSQKELYAALAKALNKPKEDIPALIKAGKIDAKTAIDAVTQVVEKQVGGVADKLVETLPALLGRIKLAFTTLFDSIDVTPIKNVLKKVLELVSGPQAQELKKSLGAMFGSIFELIFGPLNQPGRIEAVFHGIVAAIQRVATFITGITPGIHAFIDGFIDGFKDVSPVLGHLGGAFLNLIQNLGGMGPIVKEVGRGIGLIAGVVALATEAVLTFTGVLAYTVGLFFSVGALIWDGLSYIPSLLADALEAVGQVAVQVPAYLGQAYDGVVAYIDNFLDAGLSMGSSLIHGMVDGLEANLQQALSAAGSVADAIVSHVKAILGIHSPSTVFADIAGYSVAGFAGGFDTHGSKAADAAGRMAVRAAAAANDNGFGGAQFGPSSAGAGAGRGGPTTVTFAPGAIVIGPGASGKAGGDRELARLVADEIEAKFRRMVA